ncbi:MarR family winged helix-turn-helix transcriptional regulator [Streptomyces sp. NPDC059688]|uniref:MarR family winged helix-turn-helix transcriptional regulator n=1 Tax=Streptomyces sp. NPDC059688 TaxID=3346906 RepID=UPI0036B6796B
MGEPRWLNETEMRAWTGFLETSDLLQRLIDLQLREAGGVTQVQYEILTRINDSPCRRRRMTELADLMVCSRSGLTYQVTQLEKAGLLQRESDPGDERGVLAVLTDEGHQVLSAAAPGHVRTVREGLLDVLTLEQVAQLADIMTTTRNSLRSALQQPASRQKEASAADNGAA